MSDFTASNGIPVIPDRHGGYQFVPELGQLGVLTGVNADQAQALREFFQKENDDRLGRWRWPENPDYVVYPLIAGLVAVVEEKNGTSGTFSRSEHTNSGHGDAARAYFEAHPEPKPWRDAKDGEIWALSIGPNTNAYEYDARNAFFDRVGSRGTKGISAGSAGITAGHRIWPEVAS